MGEGRDPIVRRPPSRRHVIQAIATRELRLAWRRKLVKGLLIVSLLPLLLFAAVLVFGVVGGQAMKQDLAWDPVREFLQVQLFPVFLLALGLGTPMVARDRAEDVLFLYATRPVLPQHYTIAKLIAVWVPCGALVLLPGAIMAGLRLGILPGEDVTGALLMLARMGLLALAVGWAYAGLTVGASALVKRARWALAIALGVEFILDGMFSSAAGYAFGPSSASRFFLATLFEGTDPWRGWAGFAVLIAWGLIGWLVPVWQVRKEMTP